MKKLNFVTMMIAAAVFMAAGAALASQMSDRIESSARKSYVFMTYLKGDDIKIHVMNDSVVMLMGTVSQWSHRSMAEETVAGLPGVARVDDELKVKGGKPDELSDAWIGVKVKTMLMFHRNVNGFTTDVEVKNGYVVLRGKASNEAQKELTMEYVKDVEGVKNVKNEMTLEKPSTSPVEKVTEYIDDASITAQVKLALLFHRSTSVIKTTVETKDGMVTVSGVAKNGAEKDLVSKLVREIKGVKSVRNEMRVEQVSMQ